MKNEKFEPVTAKQEDGAFDTESFAGKDHEEQLQQIDDALAELDDLSMELQNPLGSAELERVGSSRVAERAGIIDRIRLKFSGKGEARREELVRIGEKESYKVLDNIERGAGADLIAIKEQLERSNKNAALNLETLRALKLDPSELEALEDKISEERSVLEQEKEIKEEELRSEIGEHPLFQKQAEVVKQIESCDGMRKLINSKRLALEKDIQVLESGRDRLRGDGESFKMAQQMIDEKLEIIKGQHKDIVKRGETIKVRLGSLVSARVEINPYVRRLQAIGKTRAELNAEAKESRKESRKDKEKKTETKKESVHHADPEQDIPDHPDDPMPEDDGPEVTPPGPVPTFGSGPEPTPESDPVTPDSQTSKEAKKEQSIVSRLQSYSQTANDWTVDVYKIAPALFGKEVADVLKKKSKFGRLDALSASHVLAQFLVDKHKMARLDVATAKVREIIEKLVK